MRTGWIWLLGSLVLAACQPSSVDELKNDPGTVTQFDVPNPPRQVLANEVEMFGKCLQYGTNEYNSTDARPSFDPERNVASVALVTQAGTVYWGLVEITPTGSGSHVQTWTPHFPDNPNFGKWVRSAAMGVQPCSGKLFGVF